MCGQYNPEACCGQDCYKYQPGNPEGCCGDVEVLEEVWTEDDYYWIHGCQKHKKEWYE